MLYAILIYGSEQHIADLPAGEYVALMERHAGLRDELAAQQRIGPAVRLQKGMTKVIRGERGGPAILDGPYAETKEQLMGIYVVDCATFDEAVTAAMRLDFETAVFEVRPIVEFIPGVLMEQTSSSDEK